MYKLTNNKDIVINLEENFFIPNDEGNIEYQKYLKWISEGNTPLPADPDPSLSVDFLRQKAYKEESDPLYFKAQRQEIDIQEWLDKVEEIRNRYPKE